jgi:hypothetical protein
MDRDLKRAQMLISLVHDGRLTDEEYRFLEKAISRYPELKLDIYRYERLHDLVGMVRGAPAPPGIEERVLESIKSEGSIKRMTRVVFFPGRRFPVEAGAIAAAAIIFLAVLISFPSVVGTDRETAVLPHDEPLSPTASVALGTTPPGGPENKTLPAEDVALIAGAADDRETGRFSAGRTDEKPLPAAPDLDDKYFSSGLSSSGSMTASGVTAEKISTVLSPARDALLSTTKKEEPTAMGSTTYIYSPSEEVVLPTILLIYRDDPEKTKKEIMDKAVSLGGTVTTEKTEGMKGKEKDDEGRHVEFFGEDAQAVAVSLPPEKINELLDYLAARYPETEKEIQDLKTRESNLFLRIDVVPTIQ